MNESPIFTRTHDLLLWLLQATRKFPRDQRFVLAARLNECAFTLQESLTAAGVDRPNSARHLVAADVALNLLRKRLLLAQQAGLLSAGYLPALPPHGRKDGQDRSAPSLAWRRGTAATRRRRPLLAGTVKRRRKAWTTTTRTPLLLFLFLGLLSSRAAGVAAALCAAAAGARRDCGTDRRGAQP